ncbi:hypothetical protein EDC54_10872 [Samsonia erythrinae]|uniref:Uncharacterized protein n=1 Tax=Samsonia erythrinae TaxID=160434 RepID=A0A4R3VLU0_9GAMM|nr:hypothetical protein EDC54_10872 [Samsonia erythrinae]
MYLNTLHWHPNCCVLYESIRFFSPLRNKYSILKLNPEVLNESL